MKRHIITALCVLVAYCALGQLNAPCFTIPIPDDTPTTYSFHNFTIDSTTINLDNTLLYALAISGEVTMLSEENSSVKVILIDNYGTHHLVYEVNSLLTDTNSFSIENVGRETIWDNPIYATTLLVRLNNARLVLNSITPITELLPNSTPQQRAQRIQAQNDTIINVLNRNLIAREIPWRAGETEVSTLSYEEKRILLGDNNTFYNIEYYVSGYYVDPAYDVESQATTSSDYIEEFDWRNRHGKYWITPVKNQGGCGSCGPFAAVALLEAYTNLYFNRMFNIDLSEQEMVSRLMTDCENGVNPIDVSQQIYETGIISELDMPYNEYIEIGIWQQIAIPNSYTTKLSIEYPFYSCTPNNLNSEEEYKSLLFQSPFCFGRFSWNHVMLLVGYKTAKAGDVFQEKDNDDYITIIINEGSKYIGKTVWICKNSWGTGKNTPGIDGYMYIITKLSDLEWCATYNGRLILEDYNNTYNYDDVLITDNDGDGYYYWGIGERPIHAPDWIPYMKDGDDGNPYLGPMGNNGYCWELGPTDTNATIIDRDMVYYNISQMQGDLIVPSGVTLTVNTNAHIFMHPDAKIIIDGGKVVLDGCTIHNGHILNKGTLIVKNGGRVMMRNGDEYVHNPENIENINNGKTPFPLYLNIEEGSFVPHQ